MEHIGIVGLKRQIDYQKMSSPNIHQNKSSIDF